MKDSDYIKASERDTYGAGEESYHIEDLIRSHAVADDIARELAKLARIGMEAIDTLGWVVEGVDDILDRYDRVIGEGSKT